MVSQKNNDFENNHKNNHKNNHNNKKTYPRILISAPVRGREWIIDDYLTSLKNLDYPKDRISFFWIINNSDKQVLGKFIDFAYQNQAEYENIFVINAHFEGLPENERQTFNRRATDPILSEMRNKISEKGMDLGVDYVFFCDSDILLPADTLLRLINRGVDCVAALVKNTRQDVQNTTFYNFLDYCKRTDKFGRYRYVNLSGLIQVGMTGACMLLSRNAFIAGIFDGKSGGEDGFARDMMGLGIKMFVDCDIRTYHAYDRGLYLADKAKGII